VLPIGSPRLGKSFTSRQSFRMFGDDTRYRGTVPAIDRLPSEVRRPYARSNHNSNAISFHKVKGFRRLANVKVRSACHSGPAYQ